MSLLGELKKCTASCLAPLKHGFHCVTRCLITGSQTASNILNDPLRSLFSVTSFYLFAGEQCLFEVAARPGYKLGWVKGGQGPAEHIQWRLQPAAEEAFE